MNSEEINRGIERYNKLQDKKALLADFKRLQKEKMVMEYIELLNKLGTKIEVSFPSDEHQIIEAFDEVALQTEDSNELYIYIGHPTEVTPGEPINMRIYKDLETGTEIKVHPYELGSFSRKHCMIHPTQYDNYTRTLEFYDELRNNFFINIVNESQEEAIRKVLQKGD